MDPQTNKERKVIKRLAKKARAKRSARIKHWMEVSRTASSACALLLSALSVAHVYNIL